MDETKNMAMTLHCNQYNETSIHRFCRGSEKETMDPGK
jgi:hypothetical protein